MNTFGDTDAGILAGQQNSIRQDIKSLTDIATLYGQKLMELHQRVITLKNQVSALRAQQVRRDAAEWMRPQEPAP